MTVQQLIELSILDAMGLLDEDERLQFESTFRAAAPAIQAHVRREQTRLSRIESLLPEVEAPAGLRAMVLEAVRAHMASEVADDGLTPLVLPMARSRSVSPLWRAASLGLAAACLMLGITTFLFQAQTQDMARQVRGDVLITQLADKFGQPFVRDVLFDRDTQHVIFDRQAGVNNGHAALFLNQKWPDAKFFCQAITTPKGKNYKLAIIDDEGEVVQVLKEFTSNGELNTIEFPMKKIKPGTAGNVAVIAAGTEPGATTVLVSGKLPSKAL